MRTLILFLFVLICSVASALCEQGDCSDRYHDLPIEETEASAGFFANYWERDGSVSVESKKIFYKAQEQSLALIRPEDFCGNDCSLRSIPYVYFQSIPTAFDQQSDDKAYCLELWKETSQQPIRFETEKIESVEELSEWIGELSQGEGEQGEVLYQKCDRACSPQYHYFITKKSVHDRNYQVEAKIRCGSERNKTSDKYRLKATFRWVCEREV